MPELVAVACPYCGETIELAVDRSAGAAAYIEDCPVCCQPMQVDVQVDDGEIRLAVKTGDE